MRRPGLYPKPSFRDPNDRRLVQIIKATQKSQPRAVNILGIPFDGAVLGRKGAKEGPAAIREAILGFSNYKVELGMSLEDARIFDLGDLVLETDDVLAVHTAVEREVTRDLNKSSLLVIVGGDNSLSLPSIRANRKKFGETGLIVIDSHFDLRGKIGGKPTSGSSYGLALEEGRGLSPRRVVEIGVHGFLNSADYAKKAKKLGVEVITATEVRDNGPAAVAQEAYRRVSRGVQAVYLSVDLDAVDLAQVSGVSAPSAGGISARELFELVFRLTKGEKVRCADLVELAPSLDPTGRSQIVAATALVYMIAGFSSRRS